MCSVHGEILHCLWFYTHDMEHLQDKLLPVSLMLYQLETVITPSTMLPVFSFEEDNNNKKTCHVEMKELERRVS